MFSFFKVVSLKWDNLSKSSYLVKSKKLFSKTDFWGKFYFQLPLSSKNLTNVFLWFYNVLWKYLEKYKKVIPKLFWPHCAPESQCEKAQLGVPDSAIWSLRGKMWHPTSLTTFPALNTADFQSGRSRQVLHTYIVLGIYPRSLLELHVAPFYHWLRLMLDNDWIRKNY